MPPSFVEELDVKGLAVPLAEPAPAPAPVARRRPARRRTVSAWDQQASALQGLTVLAVLGGAAWCAWRWWQRRRAVSPDEQQQAARPSGKGKLRPGDKGYASSFKFGSSNKQRSDEPVSAVQAIPMKPIHSSSARPGPSSKHSGNPKKKKSGKQAKKEAKKAKEREAQEAQNIASVIAARAKAKGIAEAGKPVETGLVTVMDYDKTNEAYHNVADWQETGRKSYKR